MAPRGGPSLPGLLAGPRGLPFPRWLECGLLHYPSALHPHCPVTCCLGSSLWATGLWVLCQREDASAATDGRTGELQQAHDQHLQGARVPHWGCIGAAGMEISKSGNWGFTVELGSTTAVTPVSLEKNFWRCSIVVPFCPQLRGRQGKGWGNRKKKKRGGGVAPNLVWVLAFCFISKMIFTHLWSLPRHTDLNIMFPIKKMCMKRKTEHWCRLERQVLETVLKVGLEKHSNIRRH